MSQHDLVLDNASGASFRSDANSALQALGSRQSGSSAPGTTYAHMLWVDTTNGVVKRRNAANSGWIVVETIDEAFVLGRSSNTMLDVSDKGKAIRVTGSYTQTFDAVATLGDGWAVEFRVESGATLTLDPSGSETINGVATLAILGPASGKVVCNGSALYTVGLCSQPTRTVLTSGTSATYTTPLGATRLEARVKGGGGSGNDGGDGSGNGGGGGGGGGGEGGTAVKRIVGPSATYTYTVGGAASNSSFGSVTGNGGSAGSVGDTTPRAGVGGAGGSGSGGDYIIYGAAGQSGDGGGGGTNANVGGLGGAGGGSGSGKGGTAGSNGVTASANSGAGGGGGGGGDGTSGTHGSGGGGASGIIIVDEYYD